MHFTQWVFVESINETQTLPQAGGLKESSLWGQREFPVRASRTPSSGQREAQDWNRSHLSLSSDPWLETREATPHVFPWCLSPLELVVNTRGHFLLCWRTHRGFPGGASSKEPTCQCGGHGCDPWVRKITLKREIATHSSILAWKIPWTEEPDRLQSMRLQKVRHD